MVFNLDHLTCFLRALCKRIYCDLHSSLVNNFIKIKCLSISSHNFVIHIDTFIFNIFHLLNNSNRIRHTQIIPIMSSPLHRHFSFWHLHNVLFSLDVVMRRSKRKPKGQTKGESRQSQQSREHYLDGT